MLSTSSPEIIDELVEQGPSGDESLDQFLSGEEMWVVDRHTTCLTQ